MMALLQSPEVQKLLAIQQKSQLDARYATLFKNLNLSPEQLEKFKGLLLERQASRMDVMAAARDQGIDPRTDQKGFRALMDSAQADIDTSIKAAIGDNAFAQYKSYEQTAPQRGTVNQLQQSLSYTATPLTSEQSDKLVQILAQTVPQRVAAANGQPAAAGDTGGGGGGRLQFMGGGLGGGGGGGQTSPITNETITLAQGVLTAPQVAALQQLQQAQLAQQQVGQLLRQSQTNNAGTTGGTTGTGTGGTTTTPRRNRGGG
jgi:hypothetical protein